MMKRIGKIVAYEQDESMIEDKGGVEKSDDDVKEA